jgi:hypothetical protein
MKMQCIGGKMTYRKLFRHVLNGFKDRAMEHLATDHAKESLRQRKTFAEGINAESKNRHGLRRAMFRGLAKVTIQVLMTASVQNIKRFIKFHQGSTGFFNFKELFCSIPDLAII